MPMFPVASIQSLLLEVARIALKLPVNWSLPRLFLSTLLAPLLEKPCSLMASLSLE